MERKVYPSDISRERFEVIRGMLESAKHRTAPRKKDLYDVFCAILYLLKNGCTWRALPGDFPKWNIVRYYFDQWTALKADGYSLLEQALKKSGQARADHERRAEKTRFGILGAQSVKNADTAREKGYDAGKKVSGIKRHLTVDTQGLPHAIEVTTADVTDRDGALWMLLLNFETLSAVVKLLADGAYTGEPFAQRVKMVLGAEVEIAMRSELHKFVVMPKRWVVERSFAWLDQCRRLWKNCERKLHTSQQMVVLAFVALLLRRH